MGTSYVLMSLGCCESLLLTKCERGTWWCLALLSLQLGFHLECKILLLLLDFFFFSYLTTFCVTNVVYMCDQSDDYSSNWIWVHRDGNWGFMFCYGRYTHVLWPFLHEKKHKKLHGLFCCCLMFKEIESGLQWHLKLRGTFLPSCFFVLEGTSKVLFFVSWLATWLL